MSTGLPMFVDHATSKTIVTSFYGLCDDAKGTITQIRTVCEATQASLQGPAGDAFRNATAGISAALTHAEQNIGSINTSVQGGHTKIQATTQEDAATINAGVGGLPFGGGMV